MIKVINLHKKFSNHSVLKGINEEIEKGEVVVVIGPSGSGKSTFLRCLNLIERPTEGNIVFENKSIINKTVDINIIRQQMGMVFQQFNLFPHMTVVDNVSFAPRKLKGLTKNEGLELALRLIKRVGLKDKANSYPHQLSGGQNIIIQ